MYLVKTVWTVCTRHSGNNKNKQKAEHNRPAFEQPRTAWRYGILGLGQRLRGDLLQHIYLVDETTEFGRYQSMCPESHDKCTNRKKSVHKSHQCSLPSYSMDSRETTTVEMRGRKGKPLED